MRMSVALSVTFDRSSPQYIHPFTRATILTQSSLTSLQEIALDFNLRDSAAALIINIIRVCRKSTVPFSAHHKFTCFSCTRLEISSVSMCWTPNDVFERTIIEFFTNSFRFLFKPNVLPSIMYRHLVHNALYSFSESTSRPATNKTVT